MHATESRLVAYILLDILKRTRRTEEDEEVYVCVLVWVYMYACVYKCMEF